MFLPRKLQYVYGPTCPSGRFQYVSVESSVKVQETNDQSVLQISFQQHQHVVTLWPHCCSNVHRSHTRISTKTSFGFNHMMIDGFTRRRNTLHFTTLTAHVQHLGKLLQSEKTQQDTETLHVAQTQWQQFPGDVKEG